MEKIRCKWVSNDQAMIDYHDHEWGNPIDDDQQLFTMLTLEIMQAGLSWRTVLHKREAIIQAFDEFDAAKIVLYDDDKIQQLMTNKYIIRNKRKIEATINNAKALINLQQTECSFSDFLWQYVQYTPIIRNSESIIQKNDLSDTISIQLKKRGFSFVGSITIYSFLQAVGIINDHDCTCFRNHLKTMIK